MLQEALPLEPSSYLKRPWGGAARVFTLYLAFSVIFSLFIPWLICRHYGVARHPQDFFPMPKPGGDYVATYIAGTSIFKGRNIYHNYPDTIDSFAAGTLSRYTYAPVQAYLMAPLSLLPYETSYKVWTWLTVGLIALSAFFASRLFEKPWLVFAAGFVIIAESSFLLFEMERGQTDALPLTCIVLCAYFYLKKRRPGWAGFFCALGAALKVTPAIFVLFFLLRRDWRAIIATVLSAVALVLATGVRDWITWMTETVPAYSGLYIGYTIDHSLFYFLEGFTGNLETAKILARIAAYFLAALYILLVILNKERDRYVLIELAILSIIMEISTPWSVNYKLVMVLFVFISPFAIQRIPFVAKRPVLFALPILAAFIPVVPLFNEYLARLPYSVIAAHVNGKIVVSNPLEPFLVDRRVATSLLLIFGYLVILYFIVAVRSRPRLQEKLTMRGPRFFGRIGGLRASALVMASVVVAIGVYSVRAARDEKRELRRSIDRFGAERPMNDHVSVAGYSVVPDANGHHTVRIVFRCHTPLPHNLQIYLHAHQRDAQGAIVETQGRNFFPSLITSFWPPARYVVAKTVMTCSLEPYDLNVGFFDLSDGRQYGEANLGTVNFAPSTR